MKLFIEKTKIYIIGGVIVVLGVGCLLYWGQRNRDEALDVNQIARALDEGNIREASFRLRVLLKKNPKNPQLLAYRAKLYSLLQLPEAVLAWEEVVQLHPQFVEYRVAYILALIQVGKMEKAHVVLEEWPKKAEKTVASSAYHRAALAVAFAEDNRKEAERHATRWLAENPDSERGKFNVLKIGLLSLDDPSSMQDSLRKSLMRYVHDPQFQLESAQTLIRDGFLFSNKLQVEWVVNTLRDPKSRTSSGMLLALETERRMGKEIDGKDLELAWQYSYQKPQSLSPLIGWMASRGNAESVWRLMERYPPQNPWRFPVGLALVEAAMRSNQPDRAISPLIELKWKGVDDLRLFCLAWLSHDKEGGHYLLKQAVKKSHLRPGGIEHLAHVADQWKWEKGQIAAFKELFKKGNIRSEKIYQMMALLEKEGKTQELLDITLLHLKQNPNHSGALNNAAYFGLLLGQDPKLALERVSQAYRQKPEEKKIQSTLAFAYLKNEEYAEADRILESFSRPYSSDIVLIRAFAYHKQKKALPEQLKRELKKSAYTYPEEIDLKHKLLIER